MSSSVRAGIRDRTTAFIVSENSWPLFMYDNYEADAENLECGLFKSKLLVMVSGLIFLLNYSSSHCRASKPSSLLPPPPMKLMAMAMALISSRIIDVLGDDQITPK
jgi:hypothetical protein